MTHEINCINQKILGLQLQLRDLHRAYELSGSRLFTPEDNKAFDLITRIEEEIDALKFEKLKRQNKLLLDAFALTGD